MKLSWNGALRTVLAATVTLLNLCAGLVASGQVVISSVVPADGAIAVPTNTDVVFTFSAAMNPELTYATFVDETTRESPFHVEEWSAGDTVLTCQFLNGLPANTTISWTFPIAFSADGHPLSGTTGGSFSTVSTPGANLVLSNAAYSSGTFGFDVNCSSGQVFTVQYATNLSGSPWLSLLTTNPIGTRVHVNDPRAATNRSLFYRARNGT